MIEPNASTISAPQQGDRRPIGPVIGGSLSRGLEARLEGCGSLEALRSGQMVVVEGERYDFFGMITDLALRSTTPEALDGTPPFDLRNGPFGAILRGNTYYGVATLRLSLMHPREGAPAAAEALEPARTIPGHFSSACIAGRADVERVFGKPGEGGFFCVGSPIEMQEIPVCVDLDRLVERSSGIFGKSGTGKTFLTRLVLAGIIDRARRTSPSSATRPPTLLVFDMHNEYAHHSRREEGGTVKGLRDYFPEVCEVFTLGDRGTRRASFAVQIPYSQIEPDDILLLRDELHLNETAAECAYLAYARWGPDWFLKMVDPSEEATEQRKQLGAHEQSILAFVRKLRQLDGQCRAFLCKELPSDHLDAVARIMKNLQEGRHTILEFGQSRHALQYVLVANILTRRIHERYTEATERYLAAPEREQEPRPVVIVLEEAHKFLSPGLARQTIFGTIAREMRKYYVTLLIVDQRPSQIDPEIHSQLGTKLICHLDNERDVEAVLAGVSSEMGLRGVLANLRTKQQALILGHAVRMPVVVDTRTYGDSEFDRAIGFRTAEQRRRDAELAARQLGGL